VTPENSGLSGNLGRGVRRGDAPGSDVDEARTGAQKEVQVDLAGEGVLVQCMSDLSCYPDESAALKSF
jgi:hypothetical protein